MNIFALDLGVRTGFAHGDPGRAPTSATMILKKPDEHRAVAFGNLIAWLDQQWRAERPQLVVKEAPLPLQAFKSLGNAAFTVRVTHGLHGIVEAMCVRFGIPFEDVADATVRKHFIGKANCGNRADTKAAIVQRCQLLGYLPRDKVDHDRADALALWDYATATFGGRRDIRLHMFGEDASPSHDADPPKPRPDGPADTVPDGAEDDLDDVPGFLRRGPDNRVPDQRPPPRAPP